MTHASDGVVIGLTLLTALCFAVAVALQHKALVGDGVAQRRFGSLKFMQPLWLCGTALDVLGVVLQAIAVTVGRLSLVQPILISGLALSLAASAVLNRQRPTRTEVRDAILLTAGLVVFYFVAKPRSGSSTLQVPVFVIVVTCLTLVGFVVAGLWRHIPRRWGAVLAGLLCGISFSVTSVVTKASLSQLSDGWFAVVGSWQTWAMLAGGGAVFAFNQWVLALGALRLTLPALSVGEPIAGVALGCWCFGEQISTAALSLTVDVLLLIVLFVAIRSLSATAGATSTSV